jgi:hypothetical protein
MREKLGFIPPCPVPIIGIVTEEYLFSEQSEIAFFIELIIPTALACIPISGLSCVTAEK